MSQFHPCKKCGKKLDRKGGFWNRTKAKYPVIAGYYHTNCGVIDPSYGKVGFLPF